MSGVPVSARAGAAVGYTRGVKPYVPTVALRGLQLELTLGLGDISYLDVHVGGDRRRKRSQKAKKRTRDTSTALSPPVRVRHTLI